MNIQFRRIFYCTEPGTFLHNLNSNLTAFPLGASTNTYSILSLASASRSRNILVCAGDALSHVNPKPSSSWWIAQGSKSKTRLCAHCAPTHRAPMAHLFSLPLAGSPAQMPLLCPFQIFAVLWGLCQTFNLHFLKNKGF